jgi:hypothetical protein
MSRDVFFMAASLARKAGDSQRFCEFAKAVAVPGFLLAEENPIQVLEF